ncbi:serine hydrolase domain-containing protein [Sphingomonas cavernae]|uniref:Class A beta-lactamase-related serine hydrolase n=1 Tax=Sphingomonas cavernae TaxID=2320861 RepID=A0A418WQB6_9SPHN|nr:serine hydrolase domain-containing protein [Sphingomonas cavernae]RJF93448.1 class A beta-lactamase-related serine hydrolase [Sphingomonas cavernae]
MKRLMLAVAAAMSLAAAPGAAQRPSPAASQTVATALASGAPQLTRVDVDAWLDGYMPYALQRGDVAGAVVVVVKDGQVLTQRGYGFADVATRKPVDPNATLFRPGSVSKLFTWTAVMQLVEQGKLDLDKDVNAYLDFKIPARDGKPITLRNIMTHTAGFEESLRGLIASGKAPSSLETVMKRWTPERIFAPGTTPAYSNYATALAGYIVQRASGLPFDDYVERNIFQRIGMTRSSFRQPLPANLQPLMSKGYMLGSGKPMPYEIVEAAPAGSLAATGADMAKFMIAHLDNGGVLLKPETATMMHRTTLPIIPPLNRMALGFYEQDLNGQRIIAHGGDTRLFHSALWLFLDRNVGMFVSLNSTGKDAAAGAIRSGLLGEFTDRYFPGAPSDGRVDAKTVKAHARMMAGSYIVSRRSQSSFMWAGAVLGQIRVRVDADGALLVDSIKTIGGAPRKWVEIAPFVWREIGGDQRLAARVVDGKVQRFSFDGASAIMLFERAPWYANAAWLNPAMIAAFAILLLTAISWPAGAIARRVYGAALPLAGRDRQAYHLMRGSALLTLMVAGGWAYALSSMSANLEMLNGKLDALILLLQGVGMIAFVGGLAVALWHMWRAWMGGRSWFAKGWSVAIFIAAALALWGAFAFGLIGFGLEY